MIYFSPISKKWPENVAPMALIVIAIIGSYFPTDRHSFVDWDDIQNFVENPWIRPTGWDSLRWALSATHLGVFQPLSWILMQLEAWVFGIDASMFRGVSLGLHIGIALILYLLCLDILRHDGTKEKEVSRGGKWITAFSVLLTMLHPLRVEVVAWSSCQPYLFAVFFGLLGFWTYLLAGWTENETSHRRRRLALFFFCLSCLSKTLILALPVVLIVLDYYPLGRFRTMGRRQIYFEKLSYILLSGITLAIGLWAHGKDHPFLTLDELTLSDRLLKVGLASSHYVRSFLWPTNLAAFYPNPASLELSSQSVGGLIFIGSVLFWLVRHRNKYPALFSTLTIVGLWLIPHVGIIPNGRVVGADRYTYLAALSMTPLLAGFLIQICQKKASYYWSVSILVGGIIIFFSIMTRTQLATWESSLSLWSRALSVANRDNAELRFNVAQSLRSLGRNDEAIPHFKKSLEIEPNFEKSLLNLGALYVDLNMPDRAIPLYNKLLERKPLSAAAHGNLGLAYLAKKNPILAGVNLEKAYSLEPEDVDFSLNLAKYYVLTQRPDKALGPVLRLLQTRRPDAELELFLGKIYFENLDFTAAEERWKKGLTLVPPKSLLHERLFCLIEQSQKTKSTLKGKELVTQKESNWDGPQAFSTPWSDQYLNVCRK